MVHIYILECINNKFYVGKTNNIQFRLDNHSNGFGSQFTKLYPPFRVYSLLPDRDDFDEDKITTNE